MADSIDVHIFKGADGSFAATCDGETSLPPGKWKPHSVITVNDGEIGRIGIDVEKALHGIAENGHYIFRAGVQFTEGQ